MASREQTLERAVQECINAIIGGEVVDGGYRQQFGTAFVRELVKALENRGAFAHFVDRREAMRQKLPEVRTIYTADDGNTYEGWDPNAIAYIVPGTRTGVILTNVEWGTKPEEEE